MSIIELGPGEFSEDPNAGPDPQPLGPVKLKTFAEHKWTVSVSTEGLQPHVALNCVDPCAMPYDYHTRKLCCCEWATTGDGLDIVMDDIPVTVTNEEHYGWDYWHGDYDPGYLMAVPTCTD